MCLTQGGAELHTQRERAEREQRGHSRQDEALHHTNSSGVGVSICVLEGNYCETMRK